MARTPEDVIKAQLGQLMMEIAILTALNEKLTEEVAALKNVRESDKKLKGVK